MPGAVFNLAGISYQPQLHPAGCTKVHEICRLATRRLRPPALGVDSPPAGKSSALTAASLCEPLRGSLSQVTFADAESDKFKPGLDPLCHSIRIVPLTPPLSPCSADFSLTWHGAREDWAASWVGLPAATHSPLRELTFQIATVLILALAAQPSRLRDGTASRRSGQVEARRSQNSQARMPELRELRVAGASRVVVALDLPAVDGVIAEQLFDAEQLIVLGDAIGAAE
jgi:hypothetical protein